MNTDRQTVNQFSVDAEFYNLVNQELLTDSVSTDVFWNSLTDILKQHTGATLSAVSAVSDAQQSSVSLLHPRYALKALNARWGSLYSALYHEAAIPHSAGLKTGSKYNVARGTRVTGYAKEFLDSAFPLTEGSHKDAASYLVYFQNLMVILADGSTVGLKNPAHFAAKSGPKSEPDSIVLKHQDLHVEISFDRRGLHGSQDIANIDDIRVEAPANTLISFRASTVAEKCEIYRNFKALVKGDLKASFDRQGKHHTRRLNHNDSYTAKDGDSYAISGCNPMVVQLQATDNLTTICDENNQAVPAALIDTIVATLVMLYAQDDDSISVSLMAPYVELSNQTQTVLEQLCAIPGMPVTGLNLVTYTSEQPDETKGFARTADMHPRRLPCTGVAEEELKNTVTMATQNGAVLKAINHIAA